MVKWQQENGRGNDMEHEKFHYSSIAEIREKANAADLQLPLSDRTEVLFTPAQAQGLRFENRFVIQPMEGCDATDAGAPGELTRRRYERFARSGAGLIWMEAVAIQKQARAKPHQLLATDAQLDSFKRLVEQIRETSLRENGFAPILIMQAAHSGRYSNPNGYPEPIIAYNNPCFEKEHPIDPGRIITDDALKQLEADFGWAAGFAERAGFDGVDIKCCHRYLCSEMLSAYNRPGEYGGSFENRTRLLRNGIQAAKANTSAKFLVTSRLNVYDGFAYPYGFGVAADGSLRPDLTEPLQLIGILHHQLGLKLLNVTIGNPYVNPHVNRPYDHGNYIPAEHPFEGLSRMMHCVGAVQREYRDLAVIGSGFSYLRQFSVNMAAGAVEEGDCTLAGFGRQAFAYPQFIQDLKRNGALDSRKVCVTCGECAKLLRAGECAGCVVRDAEVYHRHG